MTIQLGTVIHGTLRTQDLLRAFARELEQFKGSRYYVQISPNVKSDLIEDARRFADKLDLSSDKYDEEEADTIVSQLMDELNECAPEGVYFGAHEGDGSDFGFWKAEQ